MMENPFASLLTRTATPSKVSQELVVPDQENTNNRVSKTSTGKGTSTGTSTGKRNGITSPASNSNMLRK